MILFLIAFTNDSKGGGHSISIILIHSIGYTYKNTRNKKPQLYLFVYIGRFNDSIRTAPISIQNKHTISHQNNLRDFIGL